MEDFNKVLENKIRQNQADYDLYRKNAKISTLSSDKIDKYEYLTGEDFEYKPDAVQKAKFEYSPLGQAFNKGLEKDEKQEGLLKRLKNIEDKTDNQLLAIRDQEDTQLDLIDEINAGRTKIIGFQNERLKNLEKEIRNKGKGIRKNKSRKKKEEKDRAIFNYSAADDTPFCFSDDTKLLNFAEDLYKQDLPFDEAKKEQEEMKKTKKKQKLKALKKRIKPSAGPRPNKSNKEIMENVVKNAEGIYRLRKKIVYEIKRVRMEQAEEGEEDEELDLSWTHEPYNKVGKLISGNINMIKQIEKLKKKTFLT